MGVARLFFNERAEGAKMAERNSWIRVKWSPAALEERQLITHNKDNSKAANKSIASQTHFLRN